MNSMEQNVQLAPQFAERLGEQMWQLKQVEMWLSGLIEGENEVYELWNHRMKTSATQGRHSLSRSLGFLQDLFSEIKDLESFYD